jgi:hypothetical protein
MTFPTASPTKTVSEFEVLVAVLSTEAVHVGAEDKPGSRELDIRTHNLMSAIEAVLEENQRLKELLENRRDDY